MASRDYLIRQIEEMGIFLATILRRILKLKEENQQDQIRSVVKEALLQKSELDIDQLVVLENEDFLSLVKEHFPSEDQLEKLAGILKVLGQEIEHSFTLTQAAYLQKSYFLFVYLQETSINFSFDRRVEIEELKEILRIKGLLD